MADLVKPGDTFPALKLDLVDGGTLATPDDFTADYSLMIFYRGHW